MQDDVFAVRVAGERLGSDEVGECRGFVLWDGEEYFSRSRVSNLSVLLYLRFKFDNLFQGPQ